MNRTGKADAGGIAMSIGAPWLALHSPRPQIARMSQPVAFAHLQSRSLIALGGPDWRSFLHNEELNAVILGWDFGKQMDAMFERDLRSSVKIDPEAWARRPLDVRIKELAARVWEYWL